MLILMNLVKNPKVLLALFLTLLGLGLYFYVGLLRSEVEELSSVKIQLEEQLLQQQKVNQQNLEEMEKLREMHTADLESLKKVKELTLQREKTISNLKGRLKNVTPEDEGVVAPVLRSTLHELWNAQGADPCGTDKSGACITASGAIAVPSPASSPVPN